jgi:cytochrome P450/NADPH-cytochrome P450 reductase
MLDFQEGLSVVMPKLVPEYGGFFSASFTSGSKYYNHEGGPTVLVSDPEVLGEMYSRHEDFNKKHFKHSAMRQLLAGNGLFSSDDDEPIHDQAARILLPAFSLSGMKEYFSIIQGQTEVLKQVLERHAEEGKLVDLHHMLSCYTFDIISSIGFGMNMDAMTSSEGTAAEFLNLLEEFNAISVRMKSYAFAGPRALGAVASGDFSALKANQTRLRALLTKILASKKECVEEAKKCPVTGARGKCPVKDMGERMLTTPDPVTGELLPDENVMNQCATFLVAGHDSTSTAITMLLYQIAQHPDVEEKVYQEVMAVVGHGPITWDALGKMQYCTQVVKESLRMYSPATGPTKTSPLDRTTHLGGYEIPPGTNLVISTWGLHYNPKVYPDPWKFDPDRWSVENSKGRSPYAWLPFSYGKRACIGMQLSLLEQRMGLAELVRRFHLRVDPSTNLVTTEPIFLNPQGIFLKLTPRSQGVPAPLPLTTTHEDQVAPTIDIGRQDELRGRKLVVLFGSNMGTSEELADRLVRRGETMGMVCSKAVLDDVCHKASPIELPKGDTGLVLMVTSTYNGQPPDNAKRFDEWLKTSADAVAETFDGVRFAVFGCGNRQWAATFMAFAQKVHDAAVSNGGQCLVPLGIGDMDSGESELCFARWERSVVVALLKSHHIEVPRTIRDSLYPKMLEYQVYLSMDKRLKDFEQVGNKPIGLGIKDRAITMFLKANNAWPLTVTCNRELNKTTGRSTRHIEFQIPEGINYTAGDHFGMIGANPSEVVLDHLDYLNIPHDTVVKIDLDAGVNMSLVPLGMPIGAFQALAWCFELQGVTTRLQLRALSKLAASPQECARLERLSEWNENEAEYSEYDEQIKAKRKTVLEVLREFPSVKISLGQLMGILPVMKPRYYSISSSPKVSPGSASVTVSVVSGVSPTGRKHLGCCSTFLKDQPRLLPETVHPSRAMVAYAMIKDTGSTFRLPESKLVPVIMVGPGTGVAPMRGFIQDRIASGAKENVLFFGCRDADEYIYRDELEQWQHEGSLTLHVAFSREPKQPRQYVQDLIRVQGDALVDLVRRGAYIYVCGDATRMAPDVKATFGRIFDEAGFGDGFVEEMVKQGRYCQDVWAAQSL